MRRALVWTTVVVALLGVAYVGDNMLRGYVEDRVADAISAEFGESVGAPSVGLGGFPFALSLITRSVPQARLAVDSLPLEISGHKVELAQVVADTGAISLGTDAVTVATVTGSATLSYADLSKIADVPITYAKDGRLQLRYTRDVLGRQLTFAVSALPKLDAQAQVVRLTDPKLDLAGNSVDLGLTQEQLDSIVEPIKAELDYNLRLTSISATDGGVAVGIAGTNTSVPLP